MTAADRVVVAMSGGVDSSVAAAILNDAGYDVVGVGLRLFGGSDPADAPRSCCGIESMEDARRVAEKLDIPFYVLNFKEVFKDRVIDYFIRSYATGETPNPCVPCNSVIKFDVMLRLCMGLGVDRLATGHYAGVAIDASSGRFTLRKGVDRSKDQSYFLYSLSQEQLAAAVFPLGAMTKVETRGIAVQLGLKVHDKPESQDICFVEDGDYAAFVEKHIEPARPGPVLDESGEVIGEHGGLHRYTYGQRRGLGISMPEPMYVIDIDPESNSITVAGASRIARQKRVLLHNMNYVSEPRPESPVRVLARTRYGSKEVEATLVPTRDGEAIVEFDQPQEQTAPGQSVVLYNEDVVVAGGVARRAMRGSWTS